MDTPKIRNRHDVAEVKLERRRLILMSERCDRHLSRVPSIRLQNKFTYHEKKEKQYSERR